MRTTIDLPADLHQLARQLAHDSGRSMSDVLVSMLRSGLRAAPTDVARSGRGVPMVTIGRPVTVEDVRALEDE